MTKRTAEKAQKQGKNSTKAKTPKPPKAREIKLGSRRPTGRYFKMQRIDLEKGCELPFMTRQHTIIEPTYEHDGGARPTDFQWSVAVCEIAYAALRRGLTLLVRCRPDCAVTATAIIVNQIKGPVHVWWNCDHEVLIIVFLLDDQIQYDETED